MEKLLRGQLQQHCSLSIISCKFPIFGNHPKQVRLLWNRNGLSLLPRRLRPNLLPLLLLPRTLLLHLHSLPTRNFVPIPGLPFHPLLRPRIPHFLSPMCSLTTPPEQPPPPDSNSIKTERVVVKGRVQGVFYRDWTVQNATDLGLKGWVRNRRDGSVEALFSGPPEKVQEMEQRCRRGPPAAAVTGFQVFSSNDDPGTGFERRSTV